MSSSGINFKRGLATTAISALAVVGLPALSGMASATPLTAELGATAVKLYSQSTPSASIKNDGVNTTVHLLAGGGTDVKQVRFEYSVAGGAAQTIATVARTNDSFTTEWAPPAVVLGASVAIKAVGLDAAGADISGATASKSAVVGAGSDAVDVTNAAGSAVGVFAEPYSAAPGALAAPGHLYGAISGTTSGTNPQVKNVSADTAPVAADVKSDPVASIVTFSGVVDFAGYTFATATPTTPAVDEVVVGAQSGSDDAESVTLYNQTITNVTAAASPTNVPTGGSSVATVSVVDQNNKPVAGARVVPEGGGNPMFTNSQGKAVFTVLAGTSNFYVDTTAEAGYQGGVDFRKSVTVTTYAPALTTLASSSKDGAAFDKDENTTGDIKVTAKDQNGTEMVSGPLQGKWTITPFEAPSTPVTVAATIAPNGDVSLPAGQADGTYVLNVWHEQDGTPGQGAGDLSAAPLTVKAGQSAVKWDDANNLVQVQSGTATTQGAKLVLGDGTTLGARTLDITFAAPNGDAKLSAVQPAGTTRKGDAAATVVTAADGTFKVAVTDPAVVAPAPQPSEQGDTLDAASTALGIPVDPTKDLVIDFIDVHVETIVGAKATTLVDGQATPGRPVSQTFTLKNKAGELLKDTSVALSLDHGFFTALDKDGVLVPASGPAVGDKYGVWKNEGTTKTVSTDANGTVTVTVAIAKDAGFDDDGNVDVTLTAKAGGKTGEGVTSFGSDNALNPGAVTVEFAKDQTSRVLPKAQTGTGVWLDVFAEDQFGNLTSVWMEASDDSNVADFFTNENNRKAPAAAQSRWVHSQFTNDSPAIRAFSDAPASQIITGLWSEPDANKYIDSDLVKPGVQPARDTTVGTDVSDSAPAIQWYDIDVAKSHYSITNNGADLNPVGKTVIVTYKALDQEGNPIVRQPLAFFRSGPDDLQDGNSEFKYLTDDNGLARYIFQGAKAGTANVTGIAGDGEGNAIPESEQSTSIKFGTPPPPAPTAINAVLSGTSNGAKADVLTVKAAKANGAVVRIYKVVNGVRKLVRTGTLNASGSRTFLVKDANGRKYTKYVALVSKTADTKADTSNEKWIR